MLIQARELTKVYHRGETTLEALKSVDFSADSGEFVAIMGPSGSGKSTLLQLLGGLDTITSGKVEIGGIDLSKLNDKELSIFRRRKLGFVFQFFNLIPTLTALENVALPLLLDGHKLKSVADRAKTLLSDMNLKSRENHRPSQLSGGEMQRVAIARALITEPQLILADEPTGNLDSHTGTQVLDLLKAVVSQKGHTLIMVTHDPKAAGYASRQVFIRDGKIESDKRSN